MDLDLLHLSVLPRRQGRLFSKPEPGQPSREEWLRAVFLKEIRFPHRGSRFHYVPEPESTTAEVLAGRIGRQKWSKEAKPPSEGLEPDSREVWKASAVVIDPRHHADGQRVGMEKGTGVGRPLAVFQSLCVSLNGDDKSPYLLEVAAISSTEDFWTFVAENQGQITSVVFEFVAPNMFGMDRDVDKFMREEAEKENARRVQIKLNNPDGLILTQERLGTAAEYATQGGGSIKSTTLKRKKFNSRARVKSVRIDGGDDKTPADRISLKERLTRAIKAFQTDE